MGLLFRDDLLDEFGTLALAFIPYGGADFGEVQAVAKTVGDGDAHAFYDTWVAAGDRLVSRGHDALRAGKRVSAREALLRAAAHYVSAYHPLYGAPVDPRLSAAFRKQIAAFDEGLALLDPPVRPLRIPCGDITLPAYFLPASGHADEVRPLVILTNGYDTTVTEAYFASAVAASRRGYHSLFFDGPGQGEPLIEQGVHMRADWENVVTPVVDYALTLPTVDPKRVALMGWSLGGYLAPRAASSEHRLAACIADPGLFGIPEPLRRMLVQFGVSESAAADIGSLDQATLDKIDRAMSANERMRWTIHQRGFWVHGVDSLGGYLRAVQPFTLEGRVEDIRCPTLLTVAENDPLGAGAPAFYDALTCEKTLLRFTAADGAGEHCEIFNRSLLNDSVYDWLDDLFAGT
jgi:alpha-beta hydrolase superfamily lysophospholipase